MQLAVHNIKGERVKTIDVPDAIYNVEMNEQVLVLAVKAYQANRRQGTHATKTKSLVRGGGKKPFKQKGTGGARRGSQRSPLLPGGATVHGPQPRDYTQKVNRAVKQLAIRIALSDKVRHGKLIVVDDFKIGKYSTKEVANVLSKLKAEKALVADERKDDLLFKSARNLVHATAKSPYELNAEDLLRYEALVISETGLNALQQRLQESAHESV